MWPASKHFHIDERRPQSICEIRIHTRTKSCTRPHSVHHRQLKPNYTVYDAFGVLYRLSCSSLILCEMMRLPHQPAIAQYWLQWFYGLYEHNSSHTLLLINLKLEMLAHAITTFANWMTRPGQLVASMRPGHCYESGCVCVCVACRLLFARMFGKRYRWQRTDRDQCRMRCSFAIRRNHRCYCSMAIVRKCKWKEEQKKLKEKNRDRIDE